MTRNQFIALLTDPEWDQWCGVMLGSQNNIRVMMENWFNTEAIDNACFATLCDSLEANNIIDPTRKATLMGNQPAIGAVMEVSIRGSV